MTEKSQRGRDSPGTVDRKKQTRYAWGRAGLQWYNFMPKMRLGPLELIEENPSDKFFRVFYWIVFRKSSFELLGELAYKFRRPSARQKCEKNRVKKAAETQKWQAGQTGYKKHMFFAP